MAKDDALKSAKGQGKIGEADKLAPKGNSKMNGKNGKPPPPKKGGNRGS